MPHAHRTQLVSLPALALALVGALAACSSAPETTTASSSESGGAGGGGGGAGGASGGAGGSGGAASDCPEAATMLDVAKAPGPGGAYPKAQLTAMCTATTFVVTSNGLPHYTFVQTTPNPLKEQSNSWTIPRNPQLAAAPSDIPLLGVVGFAVNGAAFYGPNEAAQPADEAYGDPVYNGLMDACLGHTSPGEYHYHSMLVKCLDQNSLVAEPWMNADPPADAPSPVIGWALDGFPILGPNECADASCSSVVEMQSGYDQTGNPKTNAWDAYTWSAHDDATHLDKCNGHTGPGGDYHYHQTETFPYLLGCYAGTPGVAGAGGAGGAGAGAGGMMGPQSCASEADCAGACPAGSKGCTCASSPMGMICVPTCSTAADCPSGGMTFSCNNGLCVPQ